MAAGCAQSPVVAVQPNTAADGAESPTAPVGVVPQRLRSLYERLTTPAGAGIIIGRFDHDCQDEDIVEAIGGQECRVCGCFADDPS